MIVVICTAVIVVSIAGAAYYVCHTINDAKVDILHAMQKLLNEIEDVDSEIEDFHSDYRTFHESKR
jgi:prefoldin subunit 5